MDDLVLILATDLLAVSAGIVGGVLSADRLSDRSGYWKVTAACVVACAATYAVFFYYSDPDGIDSPAWAEASGIISLALAPASLILVAAGLYRLAVRR